MRRSQRIYQKMLHALEKHPWENCWFFLPPVNLRNLKFLSRRSQLRLHIQESNSIRSKMRQIHQLWQMSKYKLIQLLALEHQILRSKVQRVNLRKLGNWIKTKWKFQMRSINISYLLLRKKLRFQVLQYFLKLHQIKYKLQRPMSLQFPEQSNRMLLKLYLILFHQLPLVFFLSNYCKIALMPFFC